VPAVSVSTGNPVIAFSGEIDMAVADAVGSALSPWVRAGGPIIVDLSGVTFMDSTGLHVFVQAAQRLGERGCLIIHGAHGAVRTVLEITKLDEALENMHFIGCTVLAPRAA
jgi:anti-anti-sigma factor